MLRTSLFRAFVFSQKSALKDFVVPKQKFPRNLAMKKVIYFFHGGICQLMVNWCFGFLKNPLMKEFVT